MDRVWLYISILELLSSKFRVSRNIFVFSLFGGWLGTYFSVFNVYLPSVWIRLNLFSPRISSLSSSLGSPSAHTTDQDILGNSASCWGVRSEVPSLSTLLISWYLVLIGSLQLEFGRLWRFHFFTENEELVFPFIFVLLCPLGFKDWEEVRKDADLPSLTVVQNIFSEKNYLN